MERPHKAGGIEFDNGRQHDHRAARGLRDHFAVFRRGMHQRAAGELDSSFHTAIDFYATESMSDEEFLELEDKAQKKFKDLKKK